MHTPVFTVMLLLKNPSLPADALQTLKDYSVTPGLSLKTQSEWMSHPNLALSEVEEGLANLLKAVQAGSPLAVNSEELTGVLQNRKLSLTGLEQVTAMIEKEISQHGSGHYSISMIGILLAHVATHPHATAKLLDQVRQIVRGDLTGEAWRCLMMTIEPLERDILMQDVVWIETGRYLTEQGLMNIETVPASSSPQSATSNTSTWARLAADVAALQPGMARDTALFHWLRVAPVVIEFYMRRENIKTLNFTTAVPHDVLKTLLLSTVREVRELALSLMKPESAGEDRLSETDGSALGSPNQQRIQSTDGPDVQRGARTRPAATRSRGLL